MIESLGTNALEIFGWMSNSISDKTKTDIKGTAKALAFGAVCFAIIKTLGYLSNAKPSHSYDWTPLRNDDDSDCNCNEINDLEAPQTTTPESSNNLNTVADKVSVTMSETIIESTTEEKPSETVVEREEKSWLDQFEEAECATGINPWSVPPTSSFE